MINVTRSSLPPFEEYCEEIRELWDSHWLTNMGKKHEALEQALRDWVMETDLWVVPGEAVERFSGANKAIGTLVLNFPDRAALEKYMADDSWYRVVTV